MDPNVVKQVGGEDDASHAGKAEGLEQEKVLGAVSADEGEEDSSASPLANLDRRLVVHATAGEDASGEEDEEFAFDVEGEMEATVKRWMAVARLYSSRNFKARVMFDELSNAWGDVISRELGDNRFLLEFASERSLNLALNGGPWKFRGDALIVVRYDGCSRLSEVVIESVPLWLRIYDIPVMLQRNDVLNALGGKVGRVLEIGEAVKDFVRVRIKVMSMAGSSSAGGGVNVGARERMGGGSGGRGGGEQNSVWGGSSPSQPPTRMSGEMEGELARGVQDMAVDDAGLVGGYSQGGEEDLHAKDRVSGLNSFADSSG
ncbi:hypothetical protein HU200_039614 [Digitaria exilis]|uniref:DUF4283 domain-containing protein n=1 Tax=Digitaria exilis TaxID=1010633 RepID=A0A835BA29_9POAL|nr:hypothetical protein HU200_039614 [Digitaria exilis]